MENWVIAKAVRPPSLWQTNFKSTVLLVLTSYIQLIAFPFLYVQKMQEWQFCLKAKHLVVWTNIKITPNSDINGIGTLHATFLALAHAWLAGYSTGDESYLKKTMNFQSGAASFNVVNQLQTNRSFGCYFLLSVDWSHEKRKTSWGTAPGCAA